MNPRYPTSNQFRRHRNRKLGRPILLGLLGVMVLYFIFSSPNSSNKPNVKPSEEVTSVEEEITKHMQTSAPPTSTVPASQSVRKNVEPAVRRQPVIDTPLNPRSDNNLDPLEPHFKMDESSPSDSVKELPSLVPAKSFIALPVATQTTKPPDMSKIIASTKTTEGTKAAETAKAAKHAKTVDSAKSSETSQAAREVTSTTPPPTIPKESSESTEHENTMPSAPKELAPKPRLPDVDMTFYRELPRRKVIVPLEEPTDSQPPKTTVTHDKPPQTPANQEKTPPARGSGSYVVQLAVFNDAMRANTMVSDLQRRGVPARMVKSKDGAFYRIRLGPFPSHAEASKSLIQWKLSGYSTLIFQNNEG